MMEAGFSLPPLVFLDNSKAVPHFHCVFHIILENMEIFLSLAGGAWKAHSIMAEAGAGNERSPSVQPAMVHHKKSFRARDSRR